MYGPAPRRPKKTNIVRTRTGCKGCRKRRTKCDERKPSCGTCLRLGRLCEQLSPKLKFVTLTGPPFPKSSEDGHSSARSRRTSGISIGSLDHQSAIDSVGPSPKNTNLGGDWDWQSSASTPCSSSRSPSQDLANYVHIGDRDLIDIGWSLFNIEPSFDQGDISEVQAATAAWPRVVTEPKPRYASDALLSIPRTPIPPRDPKQPVLFYMDTWRKQCLPALHHTFHKLETLHGPTTLITDVMVALSACRLSRASPERKLLRVSNTTALCFRPNAGHEAMSHEHYGAVMRRMARWSDRDFDANPMLGLAVLVLFCYLESSMGNFREFRVHSEGTKRLIQAYPGWVVSHGAELLAAWVEVDMQNWWRRVYFSTPDFHRNHASLSLQPALEAALHTTEHRRAAVLLILSESHRLNTAAIVSCWDSCKDETGTEAVWPNTGGLSCLAPARSTNSQNEPLLSEYRVLLDEQSRKLDEWYDRLPLSDLPEYGLDTGEQAAAATSEPNTQPLRFKSHLAAMNYAYYVTARVMQCIGPLETLTTGFRTDGDITNAYEHVEAWILVLLRIAAGMDWEECVRLNVYTVGFTSLLLACVLRSHNLSMGTWMETWLEEHLKGDALEEGNFPVFQILEALRLVNLERRGGRDLFSLFQTVDDSGGSGKLGSYHSQSLVTLSVYGRCRITGRLDSYCRTL